MKTKGKIDRHVIRSAACAVFLSAVFVAPGSAVQSAKSQSEARAFSFAERVEYQRIIEDVYWRHRIWPKENPNPKPSLDAVMSQAQLENKVADYLRDSLALENSWQRPISAEQLQVEMDRMAQHTKQPAVLRELFEALGNDPAVIAECLARPILAARLIADLSAQNQTRHVESSQSDELLPMSVVTTLGQVVYTLPEIADTCTDDTWAATTTINAPVGREQQTAVWTGSEMIVWGGHVYPRVFNTGSRYNPSTDSWTATNTNNAAEGRYSHTAVWTGSEMIVWGGEDNDNLFNTGGRYNPSTNTWTAPSTTHAPTARVGHTAIWTGSQMIVWGGYDGQFSNTGGKYDPVTNTWTATSTTNVPTARGDGDTAVWTGSEMIVWGGRFDDNMSLNTGGRYNPTTNSWRATSLTNAPTARHLHTAVWTGSEMIVWGGYVLERGVYLRTRTGGKYNPATDSWVATSRFRAPAPRGEHTAVWTGNEMIVWGGNPAGPPPFNTGGRYEPITDSWRATSLTNAPIGSDEHSAVWSGSEMIVWGGFSGLQRLNTGGRYCAQPPQPAITVIQPNGGEVWPAGSVQQIKWGQNLKHTDHLIIQYSRDGGATWFRIARDIPAFTAGYWWQVDNFPTTQGRIKILLQEDLSVTDESDANFTVQRP
jgi:N-acetylneuraminic acid mutarotase